MKSKLIFISTFFLGSFLAALDERDIGVVLGYPPVHSASLFTDSVSTDSISSVNWYTGLHFAIWLTVGYLTELDPVLFLVLSIGWEVTELYLPYEFVREPLGNKVFDILANTAGFVIGTYLRKNYPP